MNTVALDSITAETDIFHHVSVLLELFPSAFCTGGNTTSSSYHLDGFYLRHFRLDSRYSSSLFSDGKVVVPLDAVFLVLYHLRVFADLHQADLKTLVLRNCAFVTAKVVERFQRLLDHNNIPSARVPSHVESHPAPLHSDTRTSLPSSSTSARDPSSSIPLMARVPWMLLAMLAGRTSLIVRRMDTPEPSTPSASRSRIPTILISPLLTSRDRRRQHATRSIRKPQKEFAFVQEKGDQEAIEDILDDGPQTSPITKAMRDPSYPAGS
ncbi:hypothetical protein CPB85DRAFT_1348285, partial [Mucidula mucida]